MKSLANRMIDNVQNWKNYYLEDRELLLQVTPPATNTPTTAPATETPLPSSTLTPSLTPTATQLLAPSPTATETPAAFSLVENPSNWLLILAVAAVGAAVYFVVNAQKSKKRNNPSK